MPGKARDQFRYKRLKRGEIRLLELDYNHNSLTGTLQHWKVECDHPGDANMHDGETCVEIPEYMALSHHWDPRPDSEDDLPALLVHNIAYQNELSELKLRPTLHAALLAIREQMIERSDWKCKLWVDAICIDQNDDDDKDRQLGKMGDIYNDARRVIVWLGTLDPDTKRGLEFVEKLQQRRILRESLSTDSNQYSEDWKCLGLLTRKPWFQRLWIVQEIAAARTATILAGSQSELKDVPWDSFAAALSLFISQFERVRTLLTQNGFFGRQRDPFGHIHLSGANVLVESREELLRKKQNGDIAEHLRSLEALLTSLSMFEVSEPHDIVYAILWLANNAGVGKRRANSTSHINTVRTPTLSPMPDFEPGHEKDCKGRKRGFSMTLSTPEMFPPLHELQAATIKEGVDTNLPMASTNSHVAADENHVSMGKSTGPMSGGIHSNANIARRNSKNLEIPDHARSMLQGRPRSYSQGYSGMSAVASEQVDQIKEPWHVTGIKIDYKQDVFTLCVQVLTYIIRTTGLLDIVCYPWAPPPRESDATARPPRLKDEESHPSWLLHDQRSRFELDDSDSGLPLTRVVRRVRADPLVGQPGCMRRPYRACGKTRASNCEILGRTLHTLGHPLGQIADIGDTANNAIIPEDWRALIGWTQADKDPPDNFWRTLVADKGLNNQPPPARFKLACKWAFDLGGKHNVDLTDVRNDGDGEPPLKEFLDCAIATVWNRRLFVTEEFASVDGRSPPSHFVGLGPKNARIGDVVCVLWGCAVPVLLRPAKLNKSVPVVSAPSITRTGTNANLAPINTGGPVQEHFTFIGECYVDGMMNGEIFHWADQHEASRRQDFFIH